MQKNFEEQMGTRLKSSATVTSTKKVLTDKFLLNIRLFRYSSKFKSAAC